MSDGTTPETNSPTTSELNQTDSTHSSNQPNTLSQPKLQSSLMKPPSTSNLAPSGLLRGMQGTSNLSQLNSKQFEPSKPQSDEVVMTKYKAYWVNKKEEDKIYSIVVELPHLETVGEAIRDVLPLFNAQLEEEESAYVLSEDPKQFDLFQAKKSGHAKTDYPALDAGQLLGQTKVDKISIVEKDPRAITLKVCDRKAVPNHNNNTQSAASSTRDSMIETSMPLELSKNTNQILNTEYTTETFCFCFKKKVPIRKPDNLNVSLQPTNLSSGLLNSPH